jgi:hypothetical protein
LNATSVRINSMAASWGRTTNEDAGAFMIWNSGAFSQTG